MEIKNFLKRILPKKWVTRYRISKQLGYKINLKHPKTFNEKIQWLKLNYKQNDLHIYADKVDVREYIRSKLGEEYLIPIYKVYNSYKDIDIESLPHEFALKAAHGCKWNIICRDKTKLDYDVFKQNIKKWGNSNYYWFGYEYSYKHIPSRFICEHLLLNEKKEIPEDYKIFCFNGVPTYIQVDTNRFSKHQRLFFDINWNLQPFEFGFKSSAELIPRPKNLKEMLQVSKTLSFGFPFVRIDLYDCNNKIYFGEMTFYPGEGSEKFQPQKWDRYFGDLLTLPNKN